MRVTIRASLMALGLAMAASGIAFAAGELEVTETTIATIKLNQTLGLTDAVDLPDGGKVTLLDKTTQKSYVCAGPYKGPIGDCPGDKKCGLIWRLLGQCGATETQTPGGTRGIRP